MPPEIQRQNIAARLVVGALYFKCGFTHIWHRNGRRNLPYRYECLVSALPELSKYGISPEDVIRLAGPMSPYWGYGNENFPAPSMPLRDVAWLLERRSRRVPNDETERALSAVWKYMTGYDGYREAFKNESEKRSITEIGVFVIDFTGDVDYEEFLEEMRRTGGNFVDCCDCYSYVFPT
jgi:hypothetical protein